MSNSPQLPSGWFPDPLGRHEHRFFNGVSWTSDVSDDGQRYVDPFGTSPGPATGGSNGAATAAVVMGSIGLAIVWIPFVVVVGLILVVLALVFGVKGLRASRTSGVGRGAAVAGLVMAACGLAASVAGIVLTVVVWNEVMAFVEPGAVSAEVTECTVDGRAVTVEGSITNLEDDERGYTVFVEVGGRTDAVIVDDVPAGATVTWTTALTTRTTIATCEPDLTIQGPFPYGIAVDPVGN